MQPTQIQIGQNDYNNLADWAKPNYQVQQSSNPVAATVPLQQPQSAIPASALQPVPAIKVPQTNANNTTSAGVIAGTQPSVDAALTNFDQAKAAVGNDAEKQRMTLTSIAESIFGQKADAQANQVNIENQLGLQEQQKALSQINTEIANEQIALRGEQEKLRQGSGSEAQKAISNNTLNDTYGRRLADLAIRQSAANQNITAIQSNAERQTKLLTAPLDTKIQYLSTFAKDNVDYLDKKQTEKLNFIVDDLKVQKQDIQALQNAKTEMIKEVARNGGGTNQELIRQIQEAGSLGEVAVIGGASGFIGALDRAQLAISRANLAINQAELKMKLDANKPIDVKSLVKDINAPAETKNNAVMLALIKSGKIGEGAKTSLSSILGVNKAIEDLANARQYTGFKGVSPIKSIVPSIDFLSSAEAVQNRGYLNAINLKVQQWASGASLTKEQIKQVNRLVPDNNDTDANVRIKMNNLVNFMNQQVAGTLASQGVDFKPASVNLFENRELYDKASPAQKAELDKIINQ